MNKSVGKTAGARRGRPPGQAGASGARERILDAARARFMAEGYQEVTLRAIAADAGVDVALVSYYFSSKQGLFGAALALPVNPIERITGVLAAPDDQIAPGLLRTFLTVWDNPASGVPLRTIVAAAVNEPSLNRIVRELIEREILTLLADRIGGDDARERAMIVAINLAGLILSRYLFAVEPIASMPVDDVIARMAPVLNAALWPPSH